MIAPPGPLPGKLVQVEDRDEPEGTAARPAGRGSGAADDQLPLSVVAGDPGGAGGDARGAGARERRTVVYTDGACIGNPGPGGWAWAVPGASFASGAEPSTTNQRMEVTAVLEALTALPGRVSVVSDSTYVVNCFRQRWWEGWMARGWKNSKRRPVANRDLWEPLVELVLLRRNQLGTAQAVTFSWVKGHSSDPMNDLVDQLALEAARTRSGRSGAAAREGEP